MKVKTIFIGRGGKSMIDKSIEWNKHLPELSRIIMDFKQGEANLDINLRANALLNKVRAEAIEDAAKLVEGNSPRPWYARVYAKQIRSLKQQTNGTER